MSANPVPVGRLVTDPNAGRDAIHIAIAPCIAPEVLDPGVPVDADGHSSSQRAVGIVDPFLEQRVNPGEGFYIFLFPNTVTSLRHEWEHPAFPKVTPSDVHAQIMSYIEQRRRKT